MSRQPLRTRKEDHDGSPCTVAGFRYTIWYVPTAFVHACLEVDAGHAGIPYVAAPHVTGRRLAAAFGRLNQELTDARSESLRIGGGSPAQKPGRTHTTA